MKNIFYTILLLLIPLASFSAIEKISLERKNISFAPDTFIRASDSVYFDTDHIQAVQTDKMFLRELEAMYKPLNFCLGFGFAFPLIGLLILKSKQKIIDAFLLKYNAKNLSAADREKIGELEKYNKTVKKVILIRLYINLAIILLYLIAMLFVLLLLLATI